MEFQIPLTREDLVKSAEAAHFGVADCLTVPEIVNQLGECQSLLERGGGEAITECFPALFSLLQNFLSVGVSIREGYWRAIVKAMEGVCRQVGGANLSEMTRTRKRDLRNSLKMVSYIVIQLVEEFETDATKPDSVDVISRKRGGKKKKKNASEPAVSEFHSSGIDWGRERERVVEVIRDLVESDLWLLWEPSSVQMMEDFSNLLLSMCYKLLENPGFVREKTAREKVVHLMGTLMKKYNMGLGVGMKVPQLLQHFEHLVSPLAQALHYWTQEFGTKNVVSEVIREIGRKDPRELAQDTSGTRSSATFLVELSQLVPTTILPSISVLLPHLSGESYTMRNGVLGVIGEIVAQVLTSSDQEESSRLTRDKLLDHLEQHLHDVNAFVRSRCLQIWLQLANAKAIPLSRLKSILPLVFGRTEDKSSNVRKSAVQLLTALLASNPFSATLNEDEFKARLATEETKLKSLLTHSHTLPHTTPPHTNTPSHTTPSHSPASHTATYRESEREGEEEDREEGEVEEDQAEREGLEIEREREKEGERDGKSGPEVELGTETEKGGERDAEVAKQATVVKYLKDGTEFIQLMNSCVPVCTRLLGSKVNTDIFESLEFLATAYEFGITGSREGVRKALGLMWSKEQQVRENVVAMYVRLFLKTPESSSTKQTAQLVTRNLLSLTDGATHSHIASLEQLLGQLMRGKHIPAPVVKLLWDIFTNRVGSVTQSHSRSAILLLSMLATAEPEIVNSNVQVLVHHGLKSHGEAPDLVMARHCLVLLQKLAVSHSGTAEPSDPPVRFPNSHAMFEEITSLLLSQFSSPVSSQWTPFAEQAIATVYKLSNKPDRLSGLILRSLVRKMESRGEEGGREGEREEGGGEREKDEREGGEGERERERDGGERGSQSERETYTTMTSDKATTQFSKDMNSLSLSRLIFVAGHVAQWQVIYLETCVARELKRRREAASDKGRESERKTPSSKTPKKNSGKKRTPAGRLSPPSLEEEMGLVGASAEDVETELIRKVCEEDVAKNSLLSLFEPLIVHVVASPSRFPCQLLQTSAALALSKYMMISQSLCEKYLQLLFTVLEKSAESAVRANTVVAAGDLAFRYPNLVEPWTDHLYARLHDSAPLVRKNAIMVLTHLILNDMIKVKGQISELALALEDEDEAISAKARYFFCQLAKKGNDIYNVIPNIISQLSDPEREIPQEKFRSITKYLFSFIQKDKQCESLVEKLCLRFRATGTEKQWRDLAYCLAQINFTDRCIRRLQDNFQCYQDKLVDQDVYTCFTGITNRAKKFAKPEIKALIAELEEMMLAAQQKGLEEREGEREIERGEGESGGEGEGEGERGEEGEQEVRTAQSEEKKTTKKEPTSPAQPLTRKKAKTTSKKSKREVKVKVKGQTTPKTERAARGRAATSRRKLKAPLVEPESDEEDLEWSEDEDFRTDVLRSARRAVANSGSITRQKPVKPVRQQKKIRRLVFSSDEDEDEEGEEREEDDEMPSSEHTVPSRFTLSDDDI